MIRLLLSLAAGTFAPPQQANVDDPFVRVADSGRHGFVTSIYDERAFETLADVHGHDGSPRSLSIPLPGNSDIVIELTPIDVWEQGGTAIVIGDDGSESRLAPSVRMFRLGVPGRASHGFLGASPDMLQGYLQLEGDPYVLSTGATRGAPLAISHGDVFGIADASEWCAVATGALAPPPVLESEPIQRTGAGATTLRTAQIFIDVDGPLRAALGSDQASIDYATLLAGASSEIYRRDLGVRFEIPNGYLRVWQTGPWLSLSDPFAAMNYATWWKSAANPKRNVPRALVHGLTHYYNPVTMSNNSGFAASIGGTCSSSVGYAVSSLEGSFPYPIQHTAATNADLFLFCHESGHVFGSAHTHQYTPKIQCDDGTGPDKGTLMSYCYNAFGIVGVGMRFHRRVQLLLRARIFAAPCITTIALQLGDYDANGILDMTDIAEFDRFVNQGFVSLGARDTFDMNGDGSVNAIDRALLVGMILAPATSSIVNGSGANCLCFGPVSQPVLGQTWTTVVGDGSTPEFVTVLVVGTGALAAPLPTRFGELLIAMDGSGGTTLLTNFRTTTGGVATHSVPLPNDAALAGLTLASQSALAKADGLHLVNALSMFVSTYE